MKLFKRAAAIMLSAILAITGMPVLSAVSGVEETAWADEDTYTDDQGVKYTLHTGDTNTASVTGHTSDYSESITIPGSITVSGVEYSVTSIGN